MEELEKRRVGVDDGEIDKAVAIVVELRERPAVGRMIETGDRRRVCETLALLIEKQPIALRAREWMTRLVADRRLPRIGPVEPEVGNERFALKALLSRGHGFIHEGPDVWSLTIQEWPEAFTEDEIHPNTRGMKIMAEAWYRAIAGEDAQDRIIEAMHARDYDVDAMRNQYLAWRASGAGG